MAKPILMNRWVSAKKMSSSTGSGATTTTSAAVPVPLASTVLGVGVGDRSAPMMTTDIDEEQSLKWRQTMQTPAFINGQPRRLSSLRRSDFCYTPAGSAALPPMPNAAAPPDYSNAQLVVNNIVRSTSNSLRNGGDSFANRLRTTATADLDYTHVQPAGNCTGRQTSVNSRPSGCDGPGYKQQLQTTTTTASEPPYQRTYTPAKVATGDVDTRQAPSNVANACAPPTGEQTHNSTFKDGRKKKASSDDVTHRQQPSLASPSRNSSRTPPDERARTAVLQRLAAMTRPLRPAQSAPPPASTATLTTCVTTQTSARHASTTSAKASPLNVTSSNRQPHVPVSSSAPSGAKRSTGTVYSRPRFDHPEKQVQLDSTQLSSGMSNYHKQPPTSLHTTELQSISRYQHVNKPASGIQQTAPQMVSNCSPLIPPLEVQQPNESSQKTPQSRSLTTSTCDTPSITGTLPSHPNVVQNALETSGTTVSCKTSTSSNSTWTPRTQIYTSNTFTSTETNCASSASELCTDRVTDIGNRDKASTSVHSNSGNSIIPTKSVTNTGSMDNGKRHVSTVNNSANHVERKITKTENLRRLDNTNPSHFSQNNAETPATGLRNQLKANAKNNQNSFATTSVSKSNMPPKGPNIDGKRQATDSTASLSAVSMAGLATLPDCGWRTEKPSYDQLQQHSQKRYFDETHQQHFRPQHELQQQYSLYQNMYQQRQQQQQYFQHYHQRVNDQNRAQLQQEQYQQKSFLNHVWQTNQRDSNMAPQNFPHYQAQQALTSEYQQREHQLTQNPQYEGAPPQQHYTNTQQQHYQTTQLSQQVHEYHSLHPHMQHQYETQTGQIQQPGQAMLHSDSNVGQQQADQHYYYKMQQHKLQAEVHHQIDQMEQQRLQSTQHALTNQQPQSQWQGFEKPQKDHQQLFSQSQKHQVQFCEPIQNLVHVASPPNVQNQSQLNQKSNQLQQRHFKPAVDQQQLEQNNASKLVSSVFDQQPPQSLNQEAHSQQQYMNYEHQQQLQTQYVEPNLYQQEQYHFQPQQLNQNHILIVQEPQQHQPPQQQYQPDDQVYQAQLLLLLQKKQPLLPAEHPTMLPSQETFRLQPAQNNKVPIEKLSNTSKRKLAITTRMQKRCEKTQNRKRCVKRAAKDTTAKTPMKKVHVDQCTNPSLSVLNDATETVDTIRNNDEVTAIQSYLATPEAEIDRIDFYNKRMARTAVNSTNSTPTAPHPTENVVTLEHEVDTTLSRESTSHKPDEHNFNATLSNGPDPDQRLTENEPDPVTRLTENVPDPDQHLTKNGPKPAEKANSVAHDVMGTLADAAFKYDDEPTSHVGDICAKVSAESKPEEDANLRVHEIGTPLQNGSEADQILTANVRDTSATIPVLYKHEDQTIALVPRLAQAEKYPTYLVHDYEISESNVEASTSIASAPVVESSENCFATARYTYLNCEDILSSQFSASGCVEPEKDESNNGHIEPICCSTETVQMDPACALSSIDIIELVFPNQTSPEQDEQTSSGSPTVFIEHSYSRVDSPGFHPSSDATVSTDVVSDTFWPDFNKPPEAVHETIVSSECQLNAMQTEDVEVPVPVVDKTVLPIPPCNEIATQTESPCSDRTNDNNASASNDTVPSGGSNEDTEMNSSEALPDSYALFLERFCTPISEAPSPKQPLHHDSTESCSSGSPELGAFATLTDPAKYGHITGAAAFCDLVSSAVLSVLDTPDFVPHSDIQSRSSPSDRPPLPAAEHDTARPTVPCVQASESSVGVVEPQLRTVVDTAEDDMSTSARRNTPKHDEIQDDHHPLPGNTVTTTASGHAVLSSPVTSIVPDPSNAVGPPPDIMSVQQGSDNTTPNSKKTKGVKSKSPTAASVSPDVVTLPSDGPTMSRSADSAAEFLPRLSARRATRACQSVSASISIEFTFTKGILRPKVVKLN